MPMRFILLSLTFLLAMPVDTRADDSADSIGRNLQAARSRFENRTAEARARFIDAMAKRGDALAKKPNLEDIKRFRDEKQAFESNGELPANPFVALERKNYENETDRAEAEFRKALETARAAYVKAGKIQEAEALDSELRAGASPVVERVKKERAPLDPIVGFFRVVVGDKRKKILNIYFPPVDNPGVRSAMARRNATSPVKYFQGSWSKSGDIYTLHFPKGATAKVKMHPSGEGFRGKMAVGATVVGLRQGR